MTSEPSANPSKRVGEFLEPSPHAWILLMLQDKAQARLQQQHVLRAELRIVQLARIVHRTTPIGRGDRIDPYEAITAPGLRFRHDRSPAPHRLYGGSNCCTPLRGEGVGVDSSARWLYDTNNTSSVWFATMDQPALVRNSRLPRRWAFDTRPRPTRTLARRLLLPFEELERSEQLEGGDANGWPLRFECKLAQVGWIGLRHLPESGSSVWSKLQDQSGSVTRIRHTAQDTELPGRHDPGRANRVSLEVPRGSATSRAAGARRGQTFGDGSIDGGRRRAGYFRTVQNRCRRRFVIKRERCFTVGQPCSDDRIHGRRLDDGREQCSCSHRSRS